MKKLISNIINRIEQFRESKPRLFKVCMLLLWIVFVEEMICIKLGILGYKKLKKNEYLNSVIEEMK